MFFKKKSKDEASTEESSGASKKDKQPEAVTGKEPVAVKPQNEKKSSDTGLSLARRRALGLGQIVSVLMKNKSTADVPLSQIAKLLQPALKTGQYLVAEMPAKAGGTPVPAAFLIWARVSETVDAKLSKGGTLADAEWASGEIPWLMLAAGKKDVVSKLITTLEKQALGGKRLKLHEPAKAAAARNVS
jgi:hemolysin-activating ACP:hemolysin acyltransferase